MNKYALSYGLQIPIASRRAARSFSRSTNGRWWFALPILLMIAFGVAYVIYVNQTAAQGYRMREIERYIETIRTENKKLELKVAELQSMESVTARLEGKNFVPVARIEYLTPGAPAVALK